MAAPAFTFGAPTPEVSAYFRDKALRPAFRWTEVWGEEHAHAFTVAKATQLEVLTTIRDSLQRAIDEGTPFEQWRQTLEPELRRQGWWGRAPMVDPATGEAREVQLGSTRRLRTIYEANLRTARAAGQWDRAQRTKAVLPYFVYELGPSIEHRPEHVAKEGRVYPVDHPFWDAWFPPNGWGCKCRVRQVGRAEAARLGGQSADEEIPTRTFTRRRDDGSRETVRVPVGIDPGWANNPGRGRAGLLNRMIEERRPTFPADLWEAAGLPSLPRSPDVSPLNRPLQPGWRWSITRFLEEPVAQRSLLGRIAAVEADEVARQGAELAARAAASGITASAEGLFLVRQYTGSLYRALNERLREENPRLSDLKLMALLDRTVREVGGGGGMAWRAPTTDWQEADRIVRSARRGQILEVEHGSAGSVSLTALSASRDFDVAASWSGSARLVYEIRDAGPGAAIARFSEHPNEDEVLLPSGLSFRVVDIRTEVDNRDEEEDDDELEALTVIVLEIVSS